MKLNIFAVLFGVVQLFSICSWAQGAGALPENDPEKCTTQMRDDPMVKPLVGKFPFDVSQAQTLEMLSNKAKPTNKEKAALSYFLTEWGRCQDNALEGIKKSVPQLVTLHSDYRIELASGLADLYSGSLTFGGFTKLRAKQYADFKSKSGYVIRELESQTLAQEKMQRDAEVEAQRKKEEKAAQEAMRWRQAIDQARLMEDERQRRYAMDDAACRNEASNISTSPSPGGSTNTTCSSFGSRIDCNTRPSSGFLAGWELGESLKKKRNYYPNCMKARGWNNPDATR